jgi:hypothetical protein
MKRQITIVNALSEDLQFISDSQDVSAVKEHIGGKLVRDYDSFFVKVADGEYTEVWGMSGIVPLLSKLVRRIK